MNVHRSAPLMVVQTFFLSGGRGWEVHLASNPDGHRLVLMTTDSVAYQEALAAEGSTRKLRATWHFEGRRQVLDELERA
jgi:hypothetical protein